MPRLYVRHYRGWLHLYAVSRLVQPTSQPQSSLQCSRHSLHTLPGTEASSSEPKQVWRIEMLRTGGLRKVTLSCLSCLSWACCIQSGKYFSLRLRVEMHYRSRPQDPSRAALTGDWLQPRIVCALDLIALLRSRLVLALGAGMCTSSLVCVQALDSTQNFTTTSPP